MKTSSKLFTSSTILLAACLLSVQGQAQCDPDSAKLKCPMKIPKGFSFIKAYEIIKQGSGEKVEYSYPFTTGTQYSIQICDPSNDFDITLFDSKRNKVFGFSPKGEVQEPVFLCPATGIYYIEISFKGKIPTCANAFIGFTRQPVNITRS